MAVTKNISFDVATILAAQGIGFAVTPAVGLDIFYGHQPDAPDECVVVLDDPGHEWLHAPFISFNVTIICRSPNATTAQAKAWAVYNCLRSYVWPYNGSAEVEIYGCIAINPPYRLPFPESEKRRFEYSSAFILKARRK